jgi:hypothetical protein
MYDTDIGADLALARVRLLNDEARRHHPDGMIVFTPGITAMPEKDQAEILERVRNFEKFAPESDPFDEHDFGAFKHEGVRVIWKIDYYDLEKCFRSPDPTDPRLTERVLTIMLATEQ